VTITHRHSKFHLVNIFAARAAKKSPQKESLVYICPGISWRFYRDTWLIIYGKATRGRVPCRSRSIAWVEISVRRDEIAITNRGEISPPQPQRGIIMHKSRQFYHTVQSTLNVLFYMRMLLFAFKNASERLTMLINIKNVIR